MAVENIKEYWDNRYAKQGELTTGFCGHNADQNDKCYAERIEFMQPIINWKLDPELILDYGCGVGRYFPMLEGYGNYYGYDVNKWAISICNDKLSCLNKEHLDFENVFSNKEPLSCTTLFTATVLQHNTDKEVGRILSKYKEAETFILYEFTGETKASHMAQRTVNDYAQIVARCANKKLIEEHSHIVHGENHTLMIFQ